MLSIHYTYKWFQVSRPCVSCVPCCCCIVTEIVVWHELSASRHKNDDDNNFYFASWRFNAHNSFRLSSMTLWPRRLALSRHVHCRLHSFTHSSKLRLSIMCSLCGKWLYSIIFLEISMQPVSLYSLIWIRCQCQIKPKTTINETSSKQPVTRLHAHLDTPFQQCLLDSTVLSLCLYLFCTDLPLQSSHSKAKIPHSLFYIFSSLYYYCSLTIIACYLLPLLLLMLVLLPSSPSPSPQPQPLLLLLLLWLLYAHLSQYHNKQTSESMKSTATTRMSDKRIMSWNTYFVRFSLSLSPLFSFILSNCVRCPNTAFRTISYFLYDNVKNNVNSITPLPPSQHRQQQPWQQQYKQKMLCGAFVYICCC